MGHRGALITLEGIEGAGKSTQARRLVEALAGDGIAAIHTVEPGGTEVGREIRAVLLNPAHGAMDPVAELLLYAAARRQHVRELIMPALNRGEVVICDRFSDSTLAYQGHARGIDDALIQEIDRIATGGLRPDLTILLDMDPADGIARNQAAGKHDRFEVEPLEFHRKVREGFLRIMEADPGRIKRIDAAGEPDQVSAGIVALVRGLISSLR